MKDDNTPKAKKNSTKKQELVLKNTDNQYVESSDDVLSNYIRVGGKFFKDVLKPDKNGKLHRVLIDWNRQNLMDDFGAKEIPKIKKYDGSIRVPSHTNYQSEIGGFRNEYFKLTHESKKGEFPIILQILNHVFQNKIDFGLDYFQLLYTKPSQRLPILLLESIEKNTGKSTLGELICLLFQENAIALGNTDFESDFSGFWLSKLCIIVDETSLDKRGIMQTIKRLSTAKGNVVSNEKNKGQKQIDFYGKFIFMSNDEGNALPIERGEDRFAVFKVPTLQSVGLKKIPNLENLIINEIPAFIYFLTNRKIVNQEKDRMYFDFEVYKTPQLMVYYQNSSSHIAKEIKQLVKDTFDIFPEEKELRFSVLNILDELKGTVKNLERMRVIKTLKTEFSLEEPKRERYTYYSRILSERSSSYFPEKNGQNNNCYVFKREN
jgi:hypothetical protein